jgi:hypothetical protein
MTASVPYVFDADPAFKVEFTENVGDVRRGPLEELWSIPFGNLADCWPN